MDLLLRFDVNENIFIAGGSNLSSVTTSIITAAKVHDFSRRFALLTVTHARDNNFDTFLNYLEHYT